MSRQVVLDTETTGLEYSEGHRIIEIGCVEVVDRRQSGRTWHHYINPEREVEAGALHVHGITDEFLADKPKFSELADEFLEFIDGSELVIHNAEFDVGFLDHELSLLGTDQPRISNIAAVIDSLALARLNHPGLNNSLDALCRRYFVDSSSRTLHGALLDAQLLAEVYLAMTGGQTALDLAVDSHAAEVSDVQREALGPRQPLRIIEASDAEIAAHQAYLDGLDKKVGGSCVWRRDA
ncbi:MAG: DNA polymerase III subunit epsilon [Lysobacteraceae bacterium]|nr:MAG: DNA polymerase III subunit epsilon [Xanthomonadaceae bacterium]